VTGGAADPRRERFLGLGWPLLLALTLVITLTPYSVDAFLPALPAAREGLSTSTSALQLTLSLFLLGVACGQLVFGPMSDRLGRRVPLVVGTAICAGAAVVCAVAPAIEVLLAARFVQGFASAAGMVVSKAIIRDRTRSSDTVRVLSFTTVGSGAMNIAAPVIGGILLEAWGWRAPLWFLAGASVVVVVVILAVVPETHAAHARDDPTRWLGLASVVRHLGNRPFLAFVLIQAGSYGTLIAYVAASPFVYQNVLGFSGSEYGVLFAINAACAVLLNLVANQFLRRLGSRRLVALGLIGSLCGSAATAAALIFGAPAGVVAVCITASMATIGLNGPNLVGLALDQVARSAGAAAATIGFVQFCAGALISPLVGVGGAGTVTPMIVSMTILAGASLLGLRAVSRRHSD
jgi:DHA1 family bicyclomycin/chloramphenicol resistance-like MFS transporter